MSMKYNSEMNLCSESGYCMPFEDRDDNVELILPYGEQIHPHTGETFFHHGVDFRTQHYILSALADGKVSGIGSDDRHGLYVNVQYGHYVVKYGHLSSCSASFGQSVTAGTMVGVSSELLHMEVHYGEEEIHPIDFIAMLYSNMKTCGRTGTTPFPAELVTLDAEISTDYDAYREELEHLMIQYYPAYMEEIRRGSYVVGKHTEQSLRNIFAVSALKDYFFEVLPSLSNPLGVSSKAAPVAAKVQNLLMADFLNYMALKHQVFLSGLSDDEKKK